MNYKINVFVYGTLLEGEYNHRRLEGATKQGNTTVVGFQMYSLGAYPACIRTDISEHEVIGEVWNVTDEILKGLDRLEGYPHFYDRVLIDTPWGATWMYYMSENKLRYSAELIPSGSWREYLGREEV